MGYLIWMICLIASFFVKDQELARLIMVVGALYFIGGAIQSR